MTSTLSVGRSETWSATRRVRGLREHFVQKILATRARVDSPRPSRIDSHDSNTFSPEGRIQENPTTAMRSSAGLLSEMLLLMVAVLLSASTFVVAKRGVGTGAGSVVVTGAFLRMVFLDSACL